MTTEAILKLLIAAISILGGACAVLWRVETNRCAEDRKKIWEQMDVIKQLLSEQQRNK